MKTNQTWSTTQTKSGKQLFQVRIQSTLSNQVREVSQLTDRSLSSITEEVFQDFIQKNRTGLRNQMSVKQQSWGKLLGGQS